MHNCEERNVRPKKLRWIKRSLGVRCFKPQGGRITKNEAVVIGLDEFEAMRLLDLEGLSQEQAAKKMKIHRSTVSRIIASGHKKIMDALVKCKTLRIEGGCCKIC